MPVLRAEPGVLHAHDPVAVHTGHRAGQPQPVAQVDRHVERLDVPGPQADRLVDEHGDAVRQRCDDRVAEGTGRQLTAQPLGPHGTRRVGAAETRTEQPVTDGPLRKSLHLHGNRVVGLLPLVDGGQPEPLAQEPAHGVLEEPHQRVELDDLGRVDVRQRRREERSARLPRAEQRPHPVVRRVVEAERPRLAELTGDEVAGVERLQRVPHQDVGGTHPTDDVEQLAERHRRGPLGAGALVGAGVEHDQPLARRQHRVEEQLPVLGTRVALADPRARGAARRHRRRARRAGTPRRRGRAGRPRGAAPSASAPSCTS